MDGLLLHNVSPMIYDLVSILDLPDDPPLCQGDVEDCLCANCRLYDAILAVIEVANPPARQA